MALLGPNGQPLPEGIGAAVRRMASRDIGSGFADTPYRAGSQRGQDVAGWNPAASSADSGWLGWPRDLAVRRTWELLATEPTAQGGVDRYGDMVVGGNWRPSVQPDHETLGISEDDAFTVGRQIERAYRLHNDDPLLRCDAEETLNTSFLLNLMLVQQVVTGDGLGVIRYRERPDWGFRTCLQVIDADRLSNRDAAPETDLHRGGVRKDRYGAPIAYDIRNAHPADLLTTTAADAYTWETIPRRMPWGRPVVLHLFEKRRAGQTRGVSRLIAGLTRFKGLERLSRSELSNAVLNALFAATITSSFDPAIVEQQFSAATAGYQDLRSKFYEDGIEMNGVRLQHLFPGDELKFLTTVRERADFGDFTAVFLRSIASGLGITYEQLTGDWSNVNYSSARAAFLEVWRGVKKARAMVAMQAATPLLLAITEDAIDQGLVTLPAHAPGLYEAAAAWLRVSWIGPPMGWVDPVKEAQAALIRIEAGISNWEDECADQGIDFELNLIKLARQKRLWETAGLMPPNLAAMLSVEAASDNEAPAKAAA